MNRLAIVDPRGFGTVSDAEVIPLRALSDKAVFDSVVVNYFTTSVLRDVRLFSVRDRDRVPN